MLRSLLTERDREKQRAEEQRKRADDLHIQNLRLQLELARYKKWYYGPRADRLNSTSELAQVLLDFGQELEQRPIHPEDVPPASEPEYELRRVKRRKRAETEWLSGLALSLARDRCRWQATTKEDCGRPG